MFWTSKTKTKYIFSTKKKDKGAICKLQICKLCKQIFSRNRAGGIDFALWVSVCRSVCAVMAKCGHSENYRKRNKTQTSKYWVKASGNREGLIVSALLSCSQACFHFQYILFVTPIWKIVFICFIHIYICLLHYVWGLRKLQLCCEVILYLAWFTMSLMKVWINYF